LYFCSLNIICKTLWSYSRISLTDTDDGTILNESTLPWRCKLLLVDWCSSSYHNSPSGHCKSPHFSIPLTVNIETLVLLL
jgi:hypothetical protein